MKTRLRKFPGTDAHAGAKMSLDVDADEQAALNNLAKLRQNKAITLETIGFMLGTAGNHISRYFNRTASITLSNYMRIARSLGYRCKITFEPVDEKGEVSLSDLNNVSHRVDRGRSPRKSN